MTWECDCGEECEVSEAKPGWMYAWCDACGDYAGDQGELNDEHNDRLRDYADNLRKAARERT